MAVLQLVLNARRMVAETLQDAVDIHDRTLESDGSGGTTETFTQRLGSTPCRFTRLLDDDPVAVAGSSFGSAEAVLIFAVGEEISEGSRVVDVRTGKVWVVTKRTSPDSNLAVIVRFGVREV